MSREQERAELYKAIWNIANDLRGSVDGWDFKQYVLGAMFYRYISENLTDYVNDGEREAGNTDFDYAQMSDEDAAEARDGLIEEKGFFLYPSELFCNVIERASDDENLNETLETIFKNIEDSSKGTESEKDFAGLFDDFDVNSNKLGATVAQRNDKLVKLLTGIAGMNLKGANNKIDAFGDAYEYLMAMYASNAGKSGGEYYTPQEVSELLTKLAINGRTTVNKVYDPACGSGSLLLQSAKILGDKKVEQGYYGQEINITTYNLCRINMFLHNISYDKFDIACADTLTDPQHWDDEPFDVIVSNPPYSVKWDGDGNPVLINDDRFSPAGVLAPKSKADLVDNNYVDAVIQMPDNLFYGTSIATCLLILKKNKTDNKIAFIDASNECKKVTNANKLEPEHIEKILGWFADRQDVEYRVKMATDDDVAAQKYNLSVSTYVEKEDTREKIDIDVLEKQLVDVVAREDELRDAIDAIIADIRS